MNAQLASVSGRLEDMGLSFMAANLESFLADEGRKDSSVLDLISAFVDTEYVPRRERAIRSRLKLSAIPSKKLLDDFDLSWLKGGLSQAKLAELKSLRFIERKENVLLMGASGLGKTHLMNGLAHEACIAGYMAYFVTSTGLMESLAHAKSQNRLKRKLSWLRKPHLLVIDEVGYENYTTEQSNLFFQVVNARYESGSIIITTNKPFSRWAEIMADDAIATAILDRLLHHAHVVSLKGDSYRMKDRLKSGVVDSVEP
jgi:DNA replication protein DnaC